LAQGSSRTSVVMACFMRSLLCSNGVKEEKQKIDELEATVMMLTAQLQATESEKASLEEELSQVKSETESFRVNSTSLRAAASMKMKHWWSRDSAIDTTCDGGSEKSTDSTADETIGLDSDTEHRAESTSGELESQEHKCTPGADKSDELAAPFYPRL